MARPVVVDGVPWHGGLPLRHLPAGHLCPYCLAQVGYLGRVFDELFGTQFHGCTFSNVMHPQEAANKQAIFRASLQGDEP